MFDSLRDPRNFLVSLARGLVESVGAPSEAPQVGAEPGAKAGYVLVREGYSLHRIDNPEAYRRAHVCHDLADLAAELRRLGSPRADIYVQPPSLRGPSEGATVFADLDPTDSDSDTLAYVAQHHARWSHWRAALDRWLTPAELREVVIIGQDDTAAVVLNGQPTGDRQGRQIAAQLRRIRVASSADVETEIDDLGMIVSSAKSGGTTVSSQIPATFAIELPVVQDLDTLVQVSIRVQARVQGGTLQYMLTAPGLAATEHQIRVAIRDRLRAALGEPWSVSLGLSRTEAYVTPTPPSPPSPPGIEVHVYPLQVGPAPEAPAPAPDPS